MDIFGIEDIPGGMSNWSRALNDWRAGFPVPLASLMRQHPTPSSVASALADFIEGKGPAPQTKGKGRARYSPSAKRSAVLDWITVESTPEYMRQNAQELAEEHRIDPEEVIGRAAELRRGLLAAIAERHGISVATLESEAKAWKAAAKARRGARKP
jgi:hypothetical protein